MIGLHVSVVFVVTVVEGISFFFSLSGFLIPRIPDQNGKKSLKKKNLRDKLGIFFFAQFHFHGFNCWKQLLESNFKKNQKLFAIDFIADENGYRNRFENYLREKWTKRQHNHRRHHHRHLHRQRYQRRRRRRHQTIAHS